VSELKRTLKSAVAECDLEYSLLVSACSGIATDTGTLNQLQKKTGATRQFNDFSDGWRADTVWLLKVMCIVSLSAVRLAAAFVPTNFMRVLGEYIDLALQPSQYSAEPQDKTPA